MKRNILSKGNFMSVILYRKKKKTKEQRLTNETVKNTVFNVVKLPNQNKS